MTFAVNRERTRFSVAFSFVCDNEKKFWSICKAIDEKKVDDTEKYCLWTPIDFAEKDSELYSTVQKFTSRNKKYAEESIGRAWVLNKEYKKNNVVKGTYQIAKTKHRITIESAGLFLFKTGIGIFWFEIGSELKSLDDIIRLNWGVKYLSHSDKSLELNMLQTATVKLNCTPRDVLSEANSNTYKVVNLPNQFVNMEFLPASGKTKKVYCAKENKLDVYYAQIETTKKYSLRELIAELLNPLEIQTFFTENIAAYQDQSICPDKSFVFSVAILENDAALNCESIAKYLFWLSRGYKQSYLPPQEGEFYEIFKPFVNSFWSASMEGCANIVCLSENDETTDVFFKNGYWERYEINFYLYILVLHQYHTLLNIANHLGKLPIELHKYHSIRGESYHILSKYNEMINLFSLKIFFSQISHISHQNELYSYLIQHLEIKQGIDEMKDTLQVVNSIVNSARQNRRSQYLKIFVILGAIFTLIETISNIISFYERGIFEIINRLPIGLFTGLSLLIIVLGSLLMWLLIRLSKIDV